jgi:membrane-associated phospholipid phosphatase
MTQQRQPAAAGLSGDFHDGPGYIFGKRVSAILHPVPLSIISIYLTTLGAATARGNALLWATFATLLQVVPMTIFFRIRLRQGAYSDEDVSIRTQRTELYVVGLVTLVLGLLAIVVFSGPPALAAMLLSAILINVIGFTINLFWKISVHAASIGTTAMMATIYLPLLGGLMWLLAILLGWARLRTRNHTLMQVIAGIVLAVCAVLASHRLYGLI